MKWWTRETQSQRKERIAIQIAREIQDQEIEIRARLLALEYRVELIESRDNARDRPSD